MKTINSLVIMTCVIFIFALNDVARAQEMLPQIIVRLDDKIPTVIPVRGADGIWRSNIFSIDLLNVEYRCTGIRKLYRGSHPSGKGLYIFSFPENSDMENISNSFTQNTNVVFVEIDYLIPVGQPRNEPNDDLFTSEQGLEQMDAPEAWDIETGSANVIIQINDTGVDFAHPDLGPNMWQNLGEDADGDGVVLIYDQQNDEWIFDAGDLNGVDDDGNGYIDDLVGWNFYNDNNDPTHTASGSTHGTQVAATVAEVGNNQIGGVGVSWNSSIMAAKTGSGGSISPGAAVAAFLYAIDNNANIINMSWGSQGSFSSINNGLLDAWNAGILPIAAAMHTIPGPGTETPWYPAAYDHVVGVTALNLDDTKQDIVQYGTWVDISAPRYDCTAQFDLGGTPEHIYGCGYGATSTASPYVAGLAALIWSNDLSLTNEEVRQRLLLSTDYIDDVNHGLEGKLGTGRINAYKALANYWRGTITVNITWSDSVTVYGDVTVNDGVTLTIEPGTVVKFNSGKKLRVYGTLIAEGTSADHITFTRIGTSGSWYGIRFENSSVDADCIIKYADIEYATFGVYVNYANPKIENNTFKNNTHGMYLSNSSPSVKTNEISQSSQHGIYMFGSDPYLFDNYIHNNSADGINGQFDSSPSLFNNSIKSNSRDGYYAFYYSSPEFGPTSGQTHGDNIVSNNGANGLYVYYYGDPFLGGGAPWSTRVGGYNTIANNTSYNVKAQSNSDVMARYNWWGASPPPSSKFYADGTSSIDRSFHLSSASASGSSLGKSAGIAPLDTNSVASLYEWGREFWLADNLNESIGVYKILIRKFPSTPEARLGVVKIAHLHRKAEMKGLAVYLSKVIKKDNDDDLVGVALDLLSSTYMKERDFDSAVMTNEKILTRSPGTGSEYIALFNLFTVYRNELKDDSRAGEFLSILKEKYPDYELTFFAQFEMGEDIDLSFAKKAIPENISQAKSIAIPKEYNLGENYPNPFNPVTQIDFAVPEDGFTRLVIYDLRGREVVRLIERDYSAGYHSVKWDGSSVASGLYFYRLQSGKFVQTKKMMLLK